MKFKITMIDPDGAYDSLQDAAKQAAAEVTGVDDDEREALVEYKMDKIQGIAKQWLEYGEYLTVEIDTEANTCTVLKRNR